MEQATQLFAAIAFLVIGLSHLSQPKAWVEFYQALAARGVPGVFLEGFLTHQSRSISRSRFVNEERIPFRD